MFKLVVYFINGAIYCMGADIIKIAKVKEKKANERLILRAWDRNLEKRIDNVPVLEAVDRIVCDGEVIWQREEEEEEEEEDFIESFGRFVASLGDRE